MVIRLPKTVEIINKGYIASENDGATEVHKPRSACTLEITAISDDAKAVK